MSNWRAITVVGAVLLVINTAALLSYNGKQQSPDNHIVNSPTLAKLSPPAEEFGVPYEHQQSLFCRLTKYNQIAALRPELKEAASSSSRDASLKLSPVVHVPISSSSGAFDMYLYKGVDAKDVDIVSNNILVTGSWEPQGIAAVKDKLLKVAMVTGETPGFMDIGANIGWFTFNMAAAGYPVLAFEPMSQNEILLRTTMCHNPTLMSRIAYFPIGLGKKESHCYMISGDGNVGDGHTVCDQGFDYKPPKDYVIRGELSTKMLSKVLSAYSCSTPGEKLSNQWSATPFGLQGTPFIGVLKIDVEGFEPNVIEGGLHFFRCAQIPYVRSEVSPGMMGGMNIAVNYMKTWISLGYELRVGDEMWNGPVLKEEDIQAFLELNNNIIDVHMVHKSWIERAANVGVKETVEKVWSNPAASLHSLVDSIPSGP
ncbi:S-adenosyl-L-methionine-dependent methyltransferase [Cladochytrium replicatum]|nr:S-adenosyl-L-methionine-dependent methyltransferase [Cladochytrium replicatum]